MLMKSTINMPTTDVSPPQGMHASTVLLLAVALFTIGKPAVGQDASATPAYSGERFLWVWTIEPVTNEQARKEFFQFCKSKRVKGVYLTTGPIVRSKKPIEESVKKFLRDAHRHGLKVFALSGDPHFSLASHHAGVIKRLQWALAMGGENSAARFDGVEFDIEPHVLDEFSKERESVLQEHLDLVTTLRDRVLKARKGFVLGLSVPFWFDSQSPQKSQVTWRGESLPVTFHMLKILNGLSPGQGRIAIAAYRDKAGGPNGSIRHSRDEIEFAANHARNVRIMVGQETKDVKGEPMITFWQEGEKEMEKAISAIVKAFKNQDVFGGVAIHHYATYRALKP
jgi:hypothetical protein